MTRSMLSRLILVGVALSGFALYATSVEWMRGHRPPMSDLAHPEVVLPVGLNVALSAGDGRLAANVNFFRALVASSEHLDPAVAGNIATLQRQTSVLDPWSEDNYYVAGATLPWWGQVEAANDILQRAADARKHDLFPLFLLGFNRQYFEGDYQAAGRAAEQAAKRATSVGAYNALIVIATKWYAHNQTPEVAMTLLHNMASRTADPALRDFIEQRIRRLQGLLVLRDASTHYQARFGHPPATLDDLTRSGVLPSLPVDPTGVGFELKPDGQVFLRNPQPLKILN